MTDKSNTKPEHKDTWRTPPELFAALDVEFDFVLDAAADEHNALCEHFINEEQDTLKISWEWMVPRRGYVWMNPPYSNPLPFVKKAAHEHFYHHIGCVMLLPADTSVSWFSEIVKSAQEVRFITAGRLAFISSETSKPVAGNNKGSLLAIWHTEKRGPCKFSTIERNELLRQGMIALKMRDNRGAA